MADELYGVLPEDFIRLRDTRADEARISGDRELAGWIKALRKPVVSAWVLNVVVRRHVDEIARLIALGGQLREAQAELAGDDLRQLGRQRREILDEVVARAREVASELGRPLTDATESEIQQTLHTALVDPAAAHTLRSGRMASPLTYSGLGPVSAAAPAATPRQHSATRTPSQAPARHSPPGERPVTRATGQRAADQRAADQRAADQQRKADDERQRRTESAGAALRDAELDVAAAVSALRSAQLRWEAATSQQAELAQRISDLRQEVHRLEEETRHAAREERQARAARDVASGVERSARRAADKARSAVEGLIAAASAGQDS